MRGLDFSHSFISVWLQGVSWLWFISSTMLIAQPLRVTMCLKWSDVYCRELKLLRWRLGSRDLPHLTWPAPSVTTSSKMLLRCPAAGSYLLTLPCFRMYLSILREVFVFKFNGAESNIFVMKGGGLSELRNKEVGQVQETLLASLHTCLSWSNSTDWSGQISRF